MPSTPDLIRKKREGGELSAAEMRALLTGYLRGDVKDYQMAAWLMAVYFRGLSNDETRVWTELMWKSGVTFPREDKQDFWIDKHSTGGVGDKTSLILVPLVTACARRLFGPHRLRLPMVSGRGLGHSGGTLDKLESVPGFSPALAIPRAMELLGENDFFMMGQTADLAPADRLLYALRDVTATVECVPLIVSSILSKKLSENLDGLVLDVKFGSGAFMPNQTRAEALAKALIDVASAQGVAVVALLTSMEEPLGWKVGHQLEVEECEDYLNGTSREPGLHEVTTALAAAMIQLGSRGALTREQAHAEIARELELPEARALYRKMFEAQGGDWDAYLAKRRAPSECQVYEARAPRDGYLARVDALAVGKLVHLLGGGRERKEDAIDPAVGVEFLKKTGQTVREGEIWAKVYYRNETQRAEIERTLVSATAFTEIAPPSLRWVASEVTAK